MKKFLYLLLLLAASSAVRAQQWYLSPVYHSRNVYSVAVLDRVNTVAGGGNEQNDSLQDIFKSVSGGMVWNFSSNQGGGYIRSMDFWDEQNGLAVGYAGKILKTANGAASWSQVTGPSPVSQRNFTTVLYQNAQTVLAFGGRNYTNDTVQTIIKSTNGGTSWTVLRDEAGRWLKGAYFTDANTGIAVGANGTIIKTTDGGSSWNPVNSPVQSRDLNAVYFIDGNTGYIAGGSYVQFDTLTSFRTILKTTDGGDSWSIVMDEAGGWLTAIDFVDQNTGYIVGDAATVFKTTNGGDNWSRITVPGSSWYSNFTSVKFLNEDYGVVGGMFGEVFLYSNEILPEAITLPASVTHVTDTNASALLRADINTHGSPVLYNFKYSTNPDFSANVGFAYLPIYPVTFNSATLITEDAEVNTLAPNTTYYYFVTVTAVNGTVNGDTLSFHTSIPFSSLQTHYPISNSGYTIFSGIVSDATEPMNLFFEYGTTPQLGNEVQATPFFVNDTMDHPVSDTIYTLLQDAIYYYRLKAVTLTDTYYAATVSFYSGSLFTDFSATAATSVTPNSAVLNAHIEGFKLPLSNIEFHYGTDPMQMNNTLAASPGAINDTLSHDITASLGSLSPDLYYYFNITGQTEVGFKYSNQMAFYTGDIPAEVEAFPATSVGETSAILNGRVSGFHLPAALSFEYGPTPALGMTFNAFPAGINDTLEHTVNTFIGNLIPSTQYWFRLVAQTSAGTIYSSLETFNTAFSENFFSTLPAREVSFSGATIRGVINQFHFPVTLSFEYGLTAGLGSEIAANPSSVNDTLHHIVSADITGLQDSTIYYFRLKASTGNQVFYTAVRQVYTAAPEIPNWDFQDYSRDTLLLPEQWNVIDETDYARVAGHSGNYALEVSKNNFVLLGFPNDNGTDDVDFIGGCPFTSRPDSVVFFLNYNLHPLDSGIFLFHLYSGDSVISSEFHFFTGNSNGSFMRFSFPVNYMSSLIPDSAVMGFIAFNALNEHVSNDPENNYLRIDDISFVPPASFICNGGFEDWFDYPVDNFDSWYSLRSVLVDPDDMEGSQTVIKAESFSPGDYAVELRNIPRLGQWMAGEIANSLGKSVFDETRSGTPVSKRYQHLNGFFKYSISPDDTLLVEVTMNRQGVNIGIGRYEATGTVNELTAFDIPIMYYSDDNAIPDSAVIVIKTNRFGKSSGYSTLTIDKLGLDGFWGNLPDTTGIASPASPERGIRIYPNPAKNNFTIELGTASSLTAFAELMDINGRVVTDVFIPEGQTRTNVDLSLFNPGIYILRFFSGAYVAEKKLIIIR